MAVFEDKALDGKGKKVDGVIDADLLNQHVLTQRNGTISI